MRRIYHKVRAKTIATAISFEDYVVPLVGFSVFFFGFGAGALLNIYLIAINHPLVTQFRAALSYKSAILGDGILLPVVNMIAASFLLKNISHVTQKVVRAALVAGLGVTLYFHVEQGAKGIVNWAMPTPWHWNFLGLWHAIYMFSVASFLSLFAIVLFRITKEEKTIPKEGIIVALGVLAFFALLKLDYIAVKLF